MTPTSHKALVAVALSWVMASPVCAQDASHPLIPGFGAIMPSKEVANPPDPTLRYRVAFEITRAAGDPAEVNPALDRVARFANLLGASGIRPAAGDVVAVIHGPATAALLGDAEYQHRFHRDNPNTPLIAALIRAGVPIHVCSYALRNAKIEQGTVARGVTVDLAAMITLSTLQLKGWALLAA